MHTAFFRSAWDDPRALFVGFKGGDNKANHSHLDLGTFVLDMLGKRWALDLGGDDYLLPGYFSNDKRWTYYRLRTEGHNTLTVNGENQQTRAKAPIVAFLATPERTFAVADLSEAYRPRVQQARRGIAVLDRKLVLVQDEVQARNPWILSGTFTRVPRSVSTTRRLSLPRTRNGWRCASCRRRVPISRPFPPIRPGRRASSRNVQNLTIRLPQKTRKARIAVLLAPVDAVKDVPALEPLDKWIAAGPLKP